MATSLFLKSILKTYFATLFISFLGRSIALVAILFRKRF